MAAKVRIEYVRAATGTDSETLQQNLGGGETLTVGGTSVPSTAAPNFPTVGSRSGLTFARVTCLQGGVCFVGPASTGTPVATEATGTRIDIYSDSVLIAIATGDKLAFIESSDSPQDTTTMPVQGVASLIPAPVVPVVQAAAYATGQQIGGKMTFPGLVRSGLTVPVLTGLLQGAILAMKTAQTVACELWLFNADPTGITSLDRAAFACPAADMTKIIDIYDFATANWKAGNPVSINSLRGLGEPFKADSSGNVYGFLVARGAVTFASVSDVAVVLKSMPD